MLKNMDLELAAGVLLALPGGLSAALCSRLWLAIWM